MSEFLANAIKDLRNVAGLTQADLAERVGVTRKTINTIENRVFTPSAILALRIARALEEPVQKVFWLEGGD